MSDIQTNNWFPWWQARWQDFDHGRAAGRVPHAMLITGPEGVGKRSFAMTLSRSLLCESPGEGGRACGACPACRLDRTGEHPDRRCVSPEEAGKEIKVDQIRALTTDLTLKSHGGGYKVAIIDPADRMNLNAANSLLKTLEEPTDNTVLLLVCQRPGNLPATIRSRCQRIRIDVPPFAEGLHWLKTNGVGEDAEQLLRVASGAPLLARKMDTEGVLGTRRQCWSELKALAEGTADPVQVAAAQAESNTDTVTGWFAGWLMDMIRLKLAPETQVLSNPDFRDSMGTIAEQVDGRTLFRLLDCTVESRRLLETPVNKRLLLEELLIRWTAATNRHRRRSGLNG